MKKIFSIITINFLLIVIDIPVKRREKGIRSDIMPIDWKNISAIKLPENVHPTIQGRDFVVATLAAPTVIKEPEKPAEATEGSEATGEEGGAQATEGAETDGKTPPADAAKSEKKGDDKKSQPEKK